MKKPVLNASRMYALMRNDVSLNFRTLLITAGIIGGLFILNNLGYFTNDNASILSVRFDLFILMIGGFVLTVNAFADTREKTKKAAYLLLPASTGEKILSRLLPTSFGWIAACILIFILSGLVVSGVNLLLYGKGLTIRRLVERTIAEPGGAPGESLLNFLEIVLQYLVLHSVFLFGSIYFRTSAFLKTLASVSLGYLAFHAVCLLATRLQFPEWYASFVPTSREYFELLIRLEKENPAWAEIIRTGGKIAYLGMTPLFFWYLAYRRLRETEVQ